MHDRAEERLVGQLLAHREEAKQCADNGQDNRDLLDALRPPQQLAGTEIDEQRNDNEVKQKLRAAHHPQPRGRYR